MVWSSQARQHRNHCASCRYQTIDTIAVSRPLRRPIFRRFGIRAFDQTLASSQDQEDHRSRKERSHRDVERTGGTLRVQQALEHSAEYEPQ